MRRTAIKNRLALLAVLLGGCVAEYRATVDTEGSETGSTGTETDAAGTVTPPPPECDEGDLLCDNACIDPEWDSNHCGECGAQCLLDTTCVAGDCVRPCGPGCDLESSVCVDGVCRCRDELTNCNGLCVNTFGDPDHCGDCWNDCPEDLPTCGDYACHADCDDFPSECEDTCTDFALDPFNCGSCGSLCGADEICAGGECEPYFALDPVQCDECPCPEACEMLCCWSLVLDTNVCVDGPACPPV